MTETTRKTVSFQMEGEGLTRMMQSWLFDEKKDAEHVIRLLVDLMNNIDVSPKVRERFAEDILLGRAAFDGNTIDGTFSLIRYEPEEQPDVPDRYNLFLRFSEERKKREQAEAERDKYRSWYATAMEHVPEAEQHAVLEETGQPIETTYGSSVLSDFMERALDQTEHTTSDYGWLEPNGTFHEVDWGDHQDFAETYIQEHMTEEEYMASFVHAPGQYKSSDLCSYGDYLIDRGWVLLHNPSQGTAFPTKNPARPYTKAQKEFLYDYYKERGKEKEANDLWNDGTTSNPPTFHNTGYPPGGNEETEERST